MGLRPGPTNESMMFCFFVFVPSAAARMCTTVFGFILNFSKSSNQPTNQPTVALDGHT